MTSNRRDRPSVSRARRGQPRDSSASGRSRTEALHPVQVLPVASAEEAGLRYVTDEAPGIRRMRAGKGFYYLGVDGKPIRDRAELARIASLGIPPAWTDVWICPRPDGHLQATGRDARGRKQYRYHQRFREVRDETKYHRLLAFAAALPGIRGRVEDDLAQPGLSRGRVLATVVRLLEATLIRVGNDEYARSNDSYGLTTLRDEHVEIQGASLRFSFRGKSGREHCIDLRDARIARIVKRCQDLPGEELFQYLDEAGEQRCVHSGDVNQYLREISGQEFTAKDFRTWAGTVLAAEQLAAIGAAATARQLKSNIVAAVDAVAARLGNTRAVCRRCYIHPAVLDAYAAGALGAPSPEGRAAAAEGGQHGLRPQEAWVAALIEASIAAAAARVSPRPGAPRGQAPPCPRTPSLEEQLRASVRSPATPRRRERAPRVTAARADNRSRPTRAPASPGRRSRYTAAAR